MKKLAIGTLCAAALVAAAFSFAMVEEKTINWAKMDEDVLVMEDLVQDTVGKAFGQMGDADLRELQQQLQQGEIEQEAYLNLLNALQREEQARALVIAQTPQVASLYLPGYGALFATRVQFALGAPPTPTPSATPKPSSRWERQRRQMLGLPELPTRAGTQPYDKDTVERVKAAVIGLLSTEAQNFTELPADERVTVFLYGPTGRESAASTRRAVSIRGEAMVVQGTIVKQGDQKFASVVSPSALADYYGAGKGSPYRTVMILSVKGSDLAQQREGKITAEELKNRIEVSQR